jgi:WD40 repeat protein
LPLTSEHCKRVFRHQLEYIGDTPDSVVEVATAPDAVEKSEPESDQPEAKAMENKSTITSIKDMTAVNALKIKFQLADRTLCGCGGRGGVLVQDALQFERLDNHLSMELPTWLNDALSEQPDVPPPKSPAKPTAPSLKPRDDSRKLGTFAKTSSQHQKADFPSLVWVQQLEQSSSILVLQVSSDGSFIVSGNAAGHVFIYSLECLKSSSTGFLFSTDATQLVGHSAEITQIAIHPHSFILTSSVDKTVRLWHPKSSQCLSIYQHPDFVTDVAWKPHLPYGMFSTTCIDGKVRSFIMTEKKLVATVEVSAPIQIVLSSPKEQIKLLGNALTSLVYLDETMLVVGNVQGVVTFLEGSNLAFHTSVQIDQKQRRNEVVSQVDEWNCKLSWSGSKIVGLVTTTPSEPSQSSQLSSQSLALRNLSGTIPLDQATVLTSGDKRKLLITTADSKVALLSIADKTIVRRFRGHKHSSRACVFGEWVGAGSQDGRVVIWKMHHLEERSLKQRLLPLDSFESYESFEASQFPITSLVACPDTTRSLLTSKGWRQQSTGQIFIVGDSAGRIRIFEQVS